MTFTRDESAHWVRTWYGLPARVVLSDDDLCDIALLGIPLLHPSLINLALRRGLPAEMRRRLFFLHELGTFRLSRYLRFNCFC